MVSTCAAFNAYLGSDDKGVWKQYDATELAAAYSGPKLPPILIDQGDDDEFLEENLTPQALVDAAKKNGGVDVELRWQVSDPLSIAGSHVCSDVAWSVCCGTHLVD